jgi:hypothetical protein
MKKITFLTILLISIQHIVLAQYPIKGRLVDTSELNSLHNSSVLLLNASDSILIDYTRADEEGNFQLKANKENDYLLLVSHPEFATYIDNVTINMPNTELSPIILTSRTGLLETIYFSDARAIMVKGDTTIYTADSFNVREFATVDELLKKLPGIEVDRNGKITAYGKEVQKMYVDGEEFFSDDPSVVAKTLQASSIDKVKVYDEKSEQAKNTGIDDGELIKTINLTLKEDAKKGLMGSVKAGYAPETLYEAEAKAQYFKGKTRIASYIMSGNNNNNNLNFEDRMNYSGESDFETTGDGYILSSRNGSYNSNNGIPQSTNAGVNYTDKLYDIWNANASYNMNDYHLKAENSEYSNYILPDTQYNREIITKSNRNSLRNAFSTRNSIDIDTMSKLNIRGSFNFTKSNTSSSTNSSYRDVYNNMLNQTLTENNIDKSNTEGRLSINYNKKFKKEGRSVNFGIAYSQQSQTSDQLFNSKNNLFAIDSFFIYYQKKYIDGSTQNITASAAYSEPIYKKLLFLQINYEYANNISKNDNRSLDIDINNNEVYNPLFSNKYDFIYNTNKAGFNFNFKNKKWTANTGLSGQYIAYHQENYTHSSLTRSYDNFNLFPRANVSYKVNTYTSLRLDYSGRTIQPTIDQIQPVIINTDPTNLRIGNDNLIQSFQNNANISYHTYSALKNYYAYVSLNGSLINNPITESQSFSEGGVRTYQYINSRSSKNANVWGLFNKNITEGFGLGVGFNGNYANSYSFNNGVEAENIYYTLNPNLSVSYDKDTTMYLSLKFTPTYNNSYTKLRADINNKFWEYNTNLTFNYTLPCKLEFSTDFNWIVRPQLTNTQKGNNIMMWNASISKRILKDRSLNIKLYAYDILNQNVGFNYNQYGYTTTRSSWNVIQQYFMLSLSWNFNTMIKKGQPKDEGGGLILIN